MIHLAGDSTVTEQPKSEPYDPARSYCGWGQMLGRLLADDMPVRNLAKSGATVASFRDEGLFSALMSAFQPGEYVLLQFGHNDQKLAALQPEGGYVAAMERMIEEIQSARGHPVLVTPVARNSWRGDTGQYNDLLASYAQAMEKLAARRNVPLLDLHARSMRWMLDLGLQAAKRYFYPGDYTHPNAYGGYQWTRFVAEEILASGHLEMRALQSHILPRESWPEMEIPPERAHPLYGWDYPPQRRESYASWDIPARLTRMQALEMAMQGYGYFATTATGEGLPLPYRAAVENGYLPAAWGQSGEAVPAVEFRELMLLAAAGRNVLPQAARALCPEADADGTITGTAAAAYARTLETLSTGCVDGPADGHTPEGA